MTNFQKKGTNFQNTIFSRQIAKQLGYNTFDAVYACRDADMFLDDFACCEDTCGAGC